MVGETHVDQLVNSMGKNITVVDTNGNSRTEKAKIRVIQNPRNSVKWDKVVDLENETRVLTMKKSSGIETSSLLKFENRDWFPGDIKQVKKRKGDVAGYRVLAYATDVGSGAELSDGSDTVQVVSDTFNDNPGEQKQGKIEIPGSDTNDLQDMGTANRKTGMAIQIGRWTTVNGNNAGDIQSVESILRGWHDNQTEIDFKRNNSTKKVVLQLGEMTKLENVAVKLAEAVVTEVNN